MSAFNALLDYDAGVQSPAPSPPPSAYNGGATQGASMGPNLSPQTVADIQGTSPLFGSHNTPLHVALLGLIALGVVILLRKAGFKFSVAGSIGGR